MWGWVLGGMLAFRLRCWMALEQLEFSLGRSAASVKPEQQRGKLQLQNTHFKHLLNFPGSLKWEFSPSVLTMCEDLLVEQEVPHVQKYSGGKRRREPGNRLRGAGEQS